MKKNLITTVIIIIVLILLALGTLVFINKKETKFFTGASGEKITVHTTNFFRMDYGINDLENETVKIGDIIEKNGIKEKVIGINDEQFITVELEE